MSTLAKRDRFSVRLGLSADEVWQRLLEHTAIRESNDPCPSPPPPSGAPFLVQRVDDSEIRIRHWAGPADATSPIVTLYLESCDRGCEVEGQFATPSSNGPLVRRPGKRRVARIAIPATLLIAALGVAYVVFGGTASLALVPLLAVLFIVPTGVVMFPMLSLWNASMRQTQTEALWGVLGELFAPLALPAAEHDAPFRAAAQSKA
jgi:hypothetical protein